MKKSIIIFLVFFLLLFCRCEKENEINPYFTIGKWTTYLPINEERTDSINVCFKAINNDHIDYYTYFLYDFKFNRSDSTLSFTLKHFDMNQYPSHTIKYDGKYDKQKDIYIGNSYRYQESIELYIHRNVITIRGW